MGNPGNQNRGRLNTLMILVLCLLASNQYEKVTAWAAQTAPPDTCVHALRSGADGLFKADVALV